MVSINFEGAKQFYARPPDAAAAQAAFDTLVNGTGADVQEAVKQVLEENTKWYQIKSRNVSASGMDMIVELKTKQEDTLAQKILAVPGVENATLMTHDGEVTY